MSYTDIGSATGGDNATEFKDFSVDSKTTDAPTQDEYTYTITDADQYLGYYKTVPELKISIDTISKWIVGKGYEAEPFTEIALMSIRGFGKDSFNSILENLIKCYHIYGDSFAEIIRESKRLINIKPLDPASMRIVANRKGVIIRYEQFNKSSKGKETLTTWQPDEILHFSRNRIADEVHGVTIIESIKWLLDARNEAMEDYRKLMHRNVYPVRIYYVDTDDTTQISTFKNMVAKAKYEGEDIIMPMGNVKTEIATVPSNATLDPKAWIQQIGNYIYEQIGVPKVVLGGSTDITQTAVQVEYLAWEQTVSEGQKYIEDQILNQLNLEINLEFPASLQNNLLSTQRKDGSPQQQMNKPSTMTPSFEQGGQVRGYF